MSTLKKMKIVLMFGLLAVSLGQHSNSQQVRNFGLNRTGDYTEVRDRLIRSGSLIKYEDFMLRLPQSRSESFGFPSGDLLAEFDWTKVKNAVTPVKYQGHCGSCVAFATMANIESLYGIYLNKELDLSEEQVIECRTDGKPACHGTHHYHVFELINSIHGVNLEKHLPYNHITTNKTLGCPKTKFFWPKYDIFTYMDHLNPTEEQMKHWLVNFGPFIVEVMGDPLQQLEFPDEVVSWDCVEGFINHEVLLVGFGHKFVNGVRKPYWKIKNSWNEQWGVNGYALIERGADTNSLCIKNRMSSAILKEMMTKKARAI